MTKKQRFKTTQQRVVPPRLPALAPFTPELLEDPAEMFLRLCSWTVPYGGETAYYGELLKAQGFAMDGCGNYYLQVPREGGGAASTCFAAHLDTCNSLAAPVNRVLVDGMCKTDGATILGADDRAGVTVLLYLAGRNIPGLYYLFVGEEAGCAGSSLLASTEGMPAHIQRVVSFDRKGKNSVVTHQSMSRTCSDEFAAALCASLNSFGLQYAPDNAGIYTDSREFAAQVSECTNLSVGYEGHHTRGEVQDVTFLSHLCRVCASVDWGALPVVRTPCDYDYSDQAGYGWDWQDDQPSLWKLSASEDHFSGSSEENAYLAIDQLAENFAMGLPVDRNAVFNLIQRKARDTVDMIEMLLDELHRAKGEYP